MKTWLYDEYLTLWDCERLDFWEAYYPYRLDFYIIGEHLEMLAAYPWLSSRIYG